MKKVWSKLKPAEKFQRKWDELGYGHECKEYRFNHERGWRFDYAWPSLQVAVEIDGFGYGHQAQQNIAKQNEKRNAAVLAGWRVLVFDSRSISSNDNCEAAVELVCTLLQREVREK